MWFFLCCLTSLSCCLLSRGLMILSCGRIGFDHTTTWCKKSFFRKGKSTFHLRNLGPNAIIVGKQGGLELFMSSEASSTMPGNIKMIISPAKTLDLSHLSKDKRLTDQAAKLKIQTSMASCDLEKTRHIASVMKGKSRGELKKMLGLSDKLAETAHGYWTNFDCEMLTSPDLSLKPAMFCFNGPAFQGLDVGTINQPTLDYLQNSLRIIDPVYGVLKPLDSLQPYRLEMGVKKLSDSTGKDLASFWRESISNSLTKDFEVSSKDNPQNILLNLASDEYSDAVDPSVFSNRASWVKVVFQQEGRVISVHAKRARGLMARFVAETRAESLEDIKRFNVEGYFLVKSKSSPDTLVFDRKKQATAANAASRKTKKEAVPEEEMVSQKKSRVARQRK